MIWPKEALYIRLKESIYAQRRAVEAEATKILTQESKDFSHKTTQLLLELVCRGFPERFTQDLYHRILLLARVSHILCSLLTRSVPDLLPMLARGVIKPLSALVMNDNRF